jgi:predicted alpha-1,2-mannosidase
MLHAAACGGSTAGRADRDGHGSEEVETVMDAVGAPDLSSLDAGVAVDLDGGEDHVDVQEPPPTRMVDLVDPLIATSGPGVRISNNFPGASAPFGMVQASPDTCNESGLGFDLFHTGGYNAGDDFVCGFSQTHLAGVGAPELGIVSFMPASAPVTETLTDTLGYLTALDHDTEVARPGYYAVTLPEAGIRVELTATQRAAHHRYAFPVEAVEARLVVFDLSHTVPSGEVTAAGLSLDAEAGILEGFVHSQNDFSGGYGGLSTFFHARVRGGWQGAHVWSEGSFLAGAASVTGPQIGVVLESEDPQVEIQVGISYVSVDGARANLEADMPAWDFEATRAGTEAAWEAVLGRIRFEGGTAVQRTLMATALYHALLMPNRSTDVSGEYRGFDKQIHTAGDFDYHTNFSLWDSYRTVHPLYLLAYPDLQRDMVRSLLDMADKGGYLPRWPMGIGYENGTLGTPADIVIAESYLKGVTDFDASAALGYMLATADGPVPPEHPFAGRRGIEEYLELGYVPVEVGSRTVSRTLEFEIADHGIARLARALGDDETADRLLQRARSYGLLWDPQVDCFRGRTAEGELEEPFDPTRYQANDYYYGGNCLHYAWLAPHDMSGYVALWDSPEAMVAGLDEFMTIGREQYESDNPVYLFGPPTHYYHGNQPDIHAPYLFAAAGRPDLTQAWVHWISDFLYTPDADGVPGNDDGGTLSAWYVFSSLGLYPVPSNDFYILGRPLFERAQVRLGPGDNAPVLVVEAPEAGGDNIYVQRATLDGVLLDHPFVRHADLMAGATLHFEMGPAPSDWGSAGLPDWVDCSQY